MAQTFYFYDLETSGVSARTSRIMQFAGQRTDMELNPIGDPHNFMIRLTDDVLAQPDAILVNGITPQKTWDEGVSEAEFCRIFMSEISQPNTTFTGFNSIRFDDEFLRFLFWRNFYDAYEWQWKDGRSRWDILDVSRITRALRPEGIKWPFSPDGKPANRLEMLADVNKLEHASAHDALSDVEATIGVAHLIKQKQPKLFAYLLTMRDKRGVKKLVESGQPFLYSSGKYSGKFEKTAVVKALAAHPDKQGMLVYDLRHDPEQFVNLNPNQLVEIWRYNKDPEALRLPVKTLQYNRCPAVAPLGVLDDAAKKRLEIDLDIIEKHRAKLTKQPGFIKNLYEAIALLNQEREQSSLFADTNSVDNELYQGFVGDKDKRLQADFRSEKPAVMSSYVSKFQDQRLKALIPLYKARNYPKSLTEEEQKIWKLHCQQSIQAAAPSFIERLQALDGQNLSKDKQYILEELKLYFESIMPDANES